MVGAEWKIYRSRSSQGLFSRFFFRAVTLGQTNIAMENSHLSWQIPTKMVDVLANYVSWSVVKEGRKQESASPPKSSFKRTANNGSCQTAWDSFFGWTSEIQFERWRNICSASGCARDLGSTVRFQQKSGRRTGVYCVSQLEFLEPLEVFCCHLWQQTKRKARGEVWPL